MAKKSGKPAPKKTAKSVAKPTGTRRIRPKHHKILRFRNEDEYPIPPKLPSAWEITRQAAKTFWRYKGLLAGVTLIYGVLNLLLAQSVTSGSDVSTLKHSLDQAFGGNLGAIASGVSIFALFVGSAGNTTNQTTGAYQIVLAIVGSLAVIYALRQSLAGNRLRVRDAYYGGMYPLIPFLLVLAVVGLEFIPLAIGSTLYALVVNNGIAIHASERIFWAAIFAASAFITIYLLCSSLFALYIITLPEMTPMKALRSARGLVRRRRWAVVRKVLWLPVVLLVVAGVIMIPIIIVVTPLARWAFFVLTMFALTTTHTYMYTLYRELLNE